MAPPRYTKAVLALLPVLLPLLLAGVTLWLLRPSSGAGREQLWALGALAPLAVTLCAALYMQQEAWRSLSAPGALAPTQITVKNPLPSGGESAVTLYLSPEQAACFEQTRRLTAHAEWVNGEEVIPLTENTRVEGQLPPPEVAGKMAVLGLTHCREWARPLSQPAP